VKEFLQSVNLTKFLTTVAGLGFTEHGVGPIIQAIIVETRYKLD